MNTLLNLRDVSRWLLMLAAAVLAGCSALQIDVDVYKGPLSNEREIQVRQYAALARSAKPVLVALRKDLESEEKLDAAKEVKEVLCFYDDPVASKRDAHRDCIWGPQDAAAQDAARRLKLLIPDCDNQPSDALPGEKGRRWIEKGRSAEGIDGLHDRWLETLSHFNMDGSRCEVQLAERHLTEALIIFAERMLYVVNNSKLFSNEKQEERSVLQTLGNTILVHANDLRRQAVHTQRQQDGFAHELKATASANRERLPTELKPDIERALDEAVTQAKRKAVAQSSKVQAAQKKVREQESALATKNAALERTRSELEAWSHEPWLSAYRSLADPAFTPGYGPKVEALVGAARDSAETDKKDLLKVGNTGLPDVPLKAEALHAAWMKWLVAQEPNMGVKPDGLLRLQRLRETATYLRKHEMAIVALLDAKPDAMQTAVRQWLDSQKTHHKADHEGVAQSAATAASAADAAKAPLKHAKEELASLRLDAEQSEPVTNAAKAKDAGMAAFEEAAKGADAAGVNTADGLRALLQKALGAKAGDAAAAAAMATLKSASLYGGFPFQDDSYNSGKSGAGSSKPTAILVVDDVIALLRNRRIRALAEGKNTDAGHLQNAIDAAYEQRASMVYIRPAADYLKNVYSATALQDENASPNRNMLLDYLRRLSVSDSPQTKARTQLEKVFWQNVNRVSLAGGGNTNYVLAKDDVGNWYVKAYSSDTTQIFQSARNLFLFNTGRKLDVNLLERADLRSRANNMGLSETERTKSAELLADKGAYTTPAEQDFASRSQQRYAAIYLAEAQSHGKDLVAAYRGWVKELNTAWAAVLKDTKDPEKSTAVAKLDAAASALYNNKLKTAAEALGDVAAAEPAGSTTTDRAARVALEVVDALDAGRRYRQQLIKDQEALDLPGLSDAQKTQLLGTTKSLLRETLDALAAKRLRSSTTYSDALTTVGDVLAAK
jgi:hypothetical protein